MKKIAMLNCEKANQTCAGAGCFRAFYERTGGFEPYGEEPLQLTAFLRCSNCGKTVAEDEGMLKKLSRLVDIGTETVHIGVCAQREGVKCETMQSHAAWLEEHGVSVVWKTH